MAGGTGGRALPALRAPPAPTAPLLRVLDHRLDRASPVGRAHAATPVVPEQADVGFAPRCAQRDHASAGDGGPAVEHEVHDDVLELTPAQGNLAAAPDPAGFHHP